MFTNIPIDLTIESIDKWNFLRDKINISKDEFMLGIQLVFNSTYFSFGQFYKQNFGIPIGSLWYPSPLSPVIADLVMRDLEARALEICIFYPRFIFVM